MSTAGTWYTPPLPIVYAPAAGTGSFILQAQQLFLPTLQNPPFRHGQPLDTTRS